MKKLLFIGLLILFFTTLRAQISLTSTNPSYSENFNSYNGSATGPTGWTLNCASFNGVKCGSFASNATGGGYAFGPATDYALGYLPSSSRANYSATVSFQNNTGAVITNLDISYDFKQFSGVSGSTRNNGFAVSSTIAGASLTGLNENANVAVLNVCTASPINKAISLTGLNIAIGATFSITFTSDRGNGSGNSRAIGLDNFSLSIPNGNPCSASTTPDLSMPTSFSTCGSADLNAIIIADANNTNPTFSWFTDAACTIPVNNPANITNSGTYYLVGTNGTCADTINTTVTINTFPDLSINATYSNCESFDLTTILVNDANNTNPTYSWFEDAAGTIAVNNPTNVTTSGTYYLVGANGTCTDTVYTDITIHLLPSLSIATDVSSCTAIDLDTISVTDANNSNATFSWFSDAACTIPIIYTNYVSTSTTYYLVGANGICTDTVHTNVSILTGPSISLATQSTGCSHIDLDTIAILDANSTNYTRQWYADAACTLPIVNPNLVPYSSTFYVIANNGTCTDTASTEVTLFPTLIPTISITVSPSEIFSAGKTFTFTAHVTNASGPSPTFTWFKNNSIIQGETNSVYTSNDFANGDKIHSVVKSNAVCAIPDTAKSNTITLSSSVSVHEEAFKPTAINVFPNPASNYINIAFTSKFESSNAIVNMMDMTGKMVFTTVFEMQEGEQLLQIENLSIAAGMYSLQIVTEKGIFSTQKIIFQ